MDHRTSSTLFVVFGVTSYLEVRDAMTFHLLRDFLPSKDVDAL